MKVGPYEVGPDGSNGGIYVGDALALAQALPDESVHCVVTSPPYFGLRDYGTAVWEGGDPNCVHRRPCGDESAGPKQQSNVGAVGRYYHRVCGKCGARRIDAQMGLEETVDAYVDRMVGLFREVRRALRSDGVFWLNIGDSFNGSGGAGGDYNEGGLRAGQPTYPGRRIDGLKPKDLIGVPWRLAFALQADGWYLRCDVIWSKGNTMPESVEDRPTRSHEYIFLFSKSLHYWYDAEAIREPNSSPEQLIHNLKYAKAYPAYDEHAAERCPGRNNSVGIHARPGGPGRNKRSVWTVSTARYDEAHFATYPPDLIEPCILAGVPERSCPRCGMPWERIVERRGGNWEERKAAGAPMRYGMNNNKGQAITNYGGSWRRTVGWRPACGCGEEPVTGIVLDPFMGAGSTGVAAMRHGRHFLGFDLNDKYVELARRRIAGTPRVLFVPPTEADVETFEQGELF